MQLFSYEPTIVSQDDDDVFVVVTYKCSLCNRLIKYGDPFSCKYGDLPKILEKVVKNQQLAGSPYLHQAPMYIHHKCKDGSAGLAHFCGFQRCRNE